MMTADEAMAHPMWPVFKQWNARFQCGVPDAADAGDRLMFEAMVYGAHWGAGPQPPAWLVNGAVKRKEGVV